MLQHLFKIFFQGTTFNYTKLDNALSSGFKKVNHQGT
jgi:hypothetical protein